ncbi:MAG: TIM-barrel domain-containing protein [Deltaproteobacteria bacterium]
MGPAFARSGYTGASQYTPMIWSGDPAASFEDSDGLPSMVRGGVNMGISGVPHWGGDIGGFHCPVDGFRAADAELVTRWVEQGSMSSNMQDQDACSGALDTGPKASIWNSVDVQRAWFEYGRLHTRLFPYLYTLAHQAHASGAPVMRHLFLEHPDHAELAGADDTYYLGPALFVAPVVQRGARTRRVVFPPGRFLDWHDASLHDGGSTATIDAPLDRLPLFLRDGYLVPLLDPTIDTLADESNVDVVGPADVAAVYDVVGFLSARAAPAVFTLWDGTRLQATWQGAFVPPASLALATSAMGLAREVRERRTLRQSATLRPCACSPFLPRPCSAAPQPRSPPTRATRRTRRATARTRPTQATSQPAPRLRPCRRTTATLSHPLCPGVARGGRPRARRTTLSAASSPRRWRARSVAP